MSGGTASPAALAKVRIVDISPCSFGDCAVLGHCNFSYNFIFLRDILASTLVTVPNLLGVNNVQIRQHLFQLIKKFPDNFRVCTLCPVHRQIVDFLNSYFWVFFEETFYGNLFPLSSYFWEPFYFVFMGILICQAAHFFLDSGKPAWLNVKISI